MMHKVSFSHMYKVSVSHLLSSGEMGVVEYPYVFEFIMDSDFITLWNVDYDVIDLPRSVYILRSINLMEGSN